MVRSGSIDRIPVYLFEVLTADDLCIPYWLDKSKSELGGNKIFCGLLFVLGLCYNLLMIRLQAFYKTSTYFLWLLTSMLYVQLSCWFPWADLPSASISFLHLGVSSSVFFELDQFFLFWSTFSAYNASIGFSWSSFSFFKPFGRVASPWVVVFNCSGFHF